MTSTVVTTIDEIIALLEAEIPANPQSLPNKRRQNKLQREMAKYFKDLGDAFPYSKLASIYNRNVKESLSSDTRGILDPLLVTFDDSLTVSLNGWMAETYLSGQAEMITWGKTKGGIPIAYEGPPISQAVDWARQHSAALVNQMAEETQRRLA